jgi:hypothetical protein
VEKSVKIVENSPYGLGFQQLSTGYSQTPPRRGCGFGYYKIILWLGKMRVNGRIFRLFFLSRPPEEGFITYTDFRRGFPS